MSRPEKQRQVADAGDVYIETARRFSHSAIFVHGISGMPESELRTAEYIRERTGGEYFLMCHGDATLGMPDGTQMEEFAFRLADDPEGLKRGLSRDVEEAHARFAPLSGTGIFDGFALCTDYCLNTGPFLSPGQFSEFVTPYLARLISGYRAMGYYTIKHTDGNIMPIIDQLVSCAPHALHSLDPQAGVDIATVKRRYGRQVCLIGNVNCGLLQTGSEEDVLRSCRAALQSGMPGGGYVFSTSNCVYTGMALSRYELMMDAWKREGMYPEPAKSVPTGS
jgi:uroporphyrinogen decarboxylase